MALHLFIITAMLYSWISTGSAYPQSIHPKVSQRTFPPELFNAFPQVSVPINDTDDPLVVPPTAIGEIECFHSGQDRPFTNVEGCRPTLNYFRTFPNYRLVQDFMEARYPKLPSKPPYAVHHTRSNCAVQIASTSPLVIDKFSFEQARALATEILEMCEDSGGHGGVAPIGHGTGWRVAVVGYVLHPHSIDTTS